MERMWSCLPKTGKANPWPRVEQSRGDRGSSGPFVFVWGHVMLVLMPVLAGSGSSLGLSQAVDEGARRQGGTEYRLKHRSLRAVLC